mgnify:CR=1 FL=1
MNNQIFPTVQFLNIGPKQARNRKNSQISVYLRKSHNGVYFTLDTTRQIAEYKSMSVARDTFRGDVYLVFFKDSTGSIGLKYDPNRHSGVCLCSRALVLVLLDALCLSTEEERTEMLEIAETKEVAGSLWMRVKKTEE